MPKDPHSEWSAGQSQGADYREPNSRSKENFQRNWIRAEAQGPRRDRKRRVQPTETHLADRRAFAILIGFFVVLLGLILPFLIRDRSESGGGGEGAGQGETSAALESLDPRVEAVANQLNRSSAEQFAVAFLRASSADAKAKLVLDPGAMLPLIKRFYQGEPNTVERYRFIEAKGYKPIGPVRYYHLEAIYSMGVGAGSDSRTIAVVPTPLGLKIDWQAFAQYDRVPLPEYIDSEVTEPAPFRVTISPSDYYNYTYSDREKYACYEVTSPWEERTVFAYVERESEVGETLEDLVGIFRAPAKAPSLPDPDAEDEPDKEEGGVPEPLLPLENQFERVILDLRKGQEGKSVRGSIVQLEIDSFVASGWVSGSPTDPG